MSKNYIKNLIKKALNTFTVLSNKPKHVQLNLCIMTPLTIDKFLLTSQCLSDNVSFSTLLINK